MKVTIHHPPARPNTHITSRPTTPTTVSRSEWGTPNGIPPGDLSNTPRASHAATCPAGTGALWGNVRQADVVPAEIAWATSHGPRPAEALRPHIRLDPPTSAGGRRPPPRTFCVHQRQRPSRSLDRKGL